MTGERRGFAADPFHHVAIAAQRVNIEIKQLESGVVKVTTEPFRCDRHTNAVAHALAQRPGGGLDASGQAELGMAGRFAIELAEIFSNRRASESVR